MMKKYILLSVVAIFACLASEPACAWEIQKPGGCGYTGPGDIVPFTAWYGMRGYSDAKVCTGTTKLARIRNTGTAEVCDILLATTGKIGLTTNCTGASAGQTANTFCSASGTTCVVATWYDQTGNNACGGSSCDLVQATNGNQPFFSFLSTTFAVYFNGSAKTLASANNFTPSSSMLSLATTALRTSNNFFGNPLNNIGSNNILQFKNNVSDVWRLAGGVSGAIDGAGVDGSFHWGVGVMNGASSVLNVDGVETTGTVVASTVAAAPSMTLSIITLQVREMGFIDNTALSAGQRTALETNMQNATF